MTFSKATIYLKSENLPLVVDNFSLVKVNGKETQPNQLIISSTDNYIFEGNNNILAINGAEIKAVYFG